MGLFREQRRLEFRWKKNKRRKERKKRKKLRKKELDLPKQDAMVALYRPLAKGTKVDPLKNAPLTSEAQDCLECLRL